MDLLHLMYQLRSGHYYLYDMRDAPNAITGERPYRLKTELVAIAFDRITGRVHQHGPPPASIHGPWVRSAACAWRATGKLQTGWLWCQARCLKKKSTNACACRATAAGC